MKKLIKILAFVLVLVVLVSPFFVSAQDNGLIKCGRTGSDGKIANPCDFNDFIGTLNGIVDWIVQMSFIIFTLTFLWGGYLYMTSGVKPGNKDKAKTVLLSTLVGFVIILLAWLIVHTILIYLVEDSADTNSIFNFIGGRK